MQLPLYLHNTLGNTKQKFIPIDKSDEKEPDQYIDVTKYVSLL